MAKYTQLANHLRAATTSPVHLTFADIESIIDSTLPASARQYSAWWSNSTHESHGWTIEWLNAGWIRDSLDIDNETVTFRRALSDVTTTIDSKQAIEGYAKDSTWLRRERNRGLAEACRKRDDNQCQACGFRLEFDGRYIIDVHHIDPLSVTDETVTSIGSLICLCPTCHRIAHLRTPDPLGTDHIVAIRQSAQVS